MTVTAKPRWHAMRTAETRKVEAALRKAGLERVDAYRYNSASIRLRVVDARFEGLSIEARDAMVEPHLEKLPERTQADIMSLYTFAPSEIESPPRNLDMRGARKPGRNEKAKVLAMMGVKANALNAEFDDPSPWIL